MPRSTLLSILLVFPVIACADATLQLGDRGAFRVQFTARELFSENQAAVYGDVFPMDRQITWEVYVAENYSDEEPAGILTWVSPTRSGRIPNEWKPVLARKNLIWIAANRSGNGSGSINRTIYAILGTELIRQHYRTDASRVYVSGFSGGGRMSSILMQQYGHIYTGAIYVCGVNFWDDIPDASKQLMRERRHVFLTGTKDFNYRDTMNVLGLYRQAGLRNYELMVIEGMGHRVPDADHFARALRYLDGG